MDNTVAVATSTGVEDSWQLKMFEKTLKKKMKMKHLRRHLGDTSSKKNFMITCGDNNGAMNHHVARFGGEWSWAEFQAHGVSFIEDLIKDPIAWVDPDSPTLPFEDATFDNVVAVDCHEHLADPIPFTSELARITKPGGRVVVSVPNGDDGMLVVKVKNIVGMSNKEYGHYVTGYGIPQMTQMLNDVDLEPVMASQYSKFFTEMIELGINFAYVKVFSKKSDGASDEATIAPQSEEQLNSIGKTYNLYRTIYPVVRTVSSLDSLLPFTKGYAVVVSATKGMNS